MCFLGLLMNQSQCLPFSNNHTLPAGGLYSILIYTFFILIPKQRTRKSRNENRENDSIPIKLFIFATAGQEFFFLLLALSFLKKLPETLDKKIDHWIYSLQNQPA